MTLYTTAEAARLLGCSRQSIANAARAGRVQARRATDQERWELVSRGRLCRNGARRALLIESSELARYARERRAPGRPGKQTSGPWWAKGRDE